MQRIAKAPTLFVVIVFRFTAGNSRALIPANNKMEGSLGIGGIARPGQAVRIVCRG
ncbi:hypothetical protein FBZ93_110186 [Bradyrhizobium macuxiense]|uniref:Uncharacterized protein n=1 Tax=Bradyrhizobium macuxiense TaxID=1755647 RepID=A0A560LDC1_9BRAD|nr:hypothetical protein FBZ93_110186 [Bradyrhizobium macuxiense]